MKSGSKLNNFATEFPNRFFDCGIAEEHAMTFAAGLAANGKRPLPFHLFCLFRKERMTS